MEGGEVKRLSSEHRRKDTSTLPIRLFPPLLALPIIISTSSMRLAFTQASLPPRPRPHVLICFGVALKPSIFQALDCASAPVSSALSNHLHPWPPCRIALQPHLTSPTRLLPHLNLARLRPKQATNSSLGRNPLFPPTGLTWPQPKPLRGPMVSCVMDNCSRP